MDMSKTHPAILNGQPTTARMMCGRWLVGGDVVQKGDQVSIALRTKWTNGRLAWHTLKGCRLTFSDFAEENLS
jgi:hypothetical protein